MHVQLRLLCWLLTNEMSCCNIHYLNPNFRFRSVKFSVLLAARMVSYFQSVLLITIQPTYPGNCLELSAGGREPGWTGGGSAGLVSLVRRAVRRGVGCAAQRWVARQVRPG